MCLCVCVCTSLPIDRSIVIGSGVSGEGDLRRWRGGEVGGGTTLLAAGLA